MNEYMKKNTRLLLLNHRGQASLEYALALIVVMFFTVGIYTLFDVDSIQENGKKMNAMGVMYGNMEYSISRPYP